MKRKSTKPVVLAAALAAACAALADGQPRSRAALHGQGDTLRDGRVDQFRERAHGFHGRGRGAQARRLFVNSDGWSEEKAAFCRAHGIELVVAERVPSPGLPARSTTALRGQLGVDR